MKEPRDVLLNKRKNGLKRAKSSATLKRDISYLNEIVTKKSPSKEFSLDSNIVQGSKIEWSTNFIEKVLKVLQNVNQVTH